MHEFNQSLKYDKRMWEADIRGSIAYAKSLCRAGLLTKQEETAILGGLNSVAKEWTEGTVRLNDCRGHVLELMKLSIISSRSRRMMRTSILPTSVG